MHFYAPFLLLSVIVACSQQQRSVFRPSDPTFVPAAGNRPRAYTSANIAVLGSVPVRSAGIIDVVVRGAETDQRAVELAIEKGQQLGCWAVIEHAAFRRLQSRLVDGATIFLAHSGPEHISHAAPRQRVVKFDCVVRGEAAQRA